MSIARAVLEFCADKKRLGAKTLFATHYHELTALERLLHQGHEHHQDHHRGRRERANCWA